MEFKYLIDWTCNERFTLCQLEKYLLMAFGEHISLVQL